MDESQDSSDGGLTPPHHGCSHAQLFKDDANGVDGLDNLAKALTYLWKHPEAAYSCTACPAQSTHSSSATAATSTVFHSTNHLCLSCVFVGCCSDGSRTQSIKLHAEQTKHPLSIHCTHRRIYCHLCNDYVYDSDFEHVLRVQRSYELEASLPRDSTRLSYEPWQLKQTQVQHAIGPNMAVRSSLYTPGFGLRGLSNLGNTCFANSVVQCMLHNPILRNYFLSDLHRKSSSCSRVHEPDMFEVGARVEALYGGGRKYFSGTIRRIESDQTYTIEYDDNDVEDDVPRENIRSEVTNQHVLCLACLLNDIFSSVYSAETDQISTHMLLFSVWKSSAHLAGYSQQDAHEFFITLLDGLHRHLTHASEPAQSSNDNCDCIIHRIFTGKLQSDVKCSTCEDVSTTFDPFWDLSLGIKHPTLNGSEPSSHPAYPSLLGCLQAFTKSEHLGADALVDCNSCGSRQQAVKRLTLRSLPVALCFHLKRFHQTNFTAPITKDQSYVSFDEYLDLRPYLAHTVATTTDEDGIETSCIPDDAFDYTLFGVVTHIGTMQQGHYIAYVKQQEQWYKCNDAVITMASRAEVLGAQAYLLFYVKSRLEYHAPEAEENT
eukprot:TRINITY_DN7288_c0_g1_i2.p1 TRINITY_DN7288_c0_g1~~TRINITY_DN7288_c0_g1_i2.p1  ORF type:complete len:602 (+),score=104.82 TRINITY_DN7288_c0_g1_i2:54-1859(+)